MRGIGRSGRARHAARVGRVGRVSRVERVGRIVVAALILVAGLATERLAGPPRAFACSCMATGPEAIGTFANEPSIVVFTGTVVSMNRNPNAVGHMRGELQIERVFKGPIPAGRMPVVGGGGGDCTMSLSEGQRMVTAARLEDGVITPGLCMPYGDPATPEGQALIREAVKAYGAGGGPPGGPVDPTAPPSATDQGPADTALPLALAGAVGVAVVLFGGLILLSRRSTSGRDA